MILLDTNVVLWLAFDPDKISSSANDAIHQARQKDEGLAISSITLLELATLSSKNRFRFSLGLASFLQHVEEHFLVLPITARACACIPGLPALYPKDPADRIIGATALTEGMALVTADREIRRSRALRTIW